MPMYPEPNRYPSADPYRPPKGRGEGGETKLVDQFTRDLTAQARLGQLDPVVGREAELTRVIQILSRRTKNNPALIGEPGVGKTAVAEALAQAICDGQVPEELRGKRLLSLELAGMVAGTKYRGEFEERVRNILAEVRRAGDVILFLDELHTVVGAGSAEGAIDAANLLKPALGRGELQVVGATTAQEYRRYIEKDAALERRFQPVHIGEPDRAQTLAILKGLRPRYERHHGIAIPDAALEAAVELAGQYLPQRRFPDKAVDLMDEAAALERLEPGWRSEEVAELERRAREAAGQREEAVAHRDYHRCLLLRQAQDSFEAQARELRRRRRKDAREAVRPETVAKVVSLWTGIPASRLTAGERERLAALEGELMEDVVGQPRAVKTVARAVRRARLGLKDPNRPAGCFLFLGPTGVGKTQLCRALAKRLFGSQDRLVRFDMSEYMDKHTAARLVGAPPGYVGYDDGGQLIRKLRDQPYSLILFDEVEKAHVSVSDLLLQIMEEGELTGGQGEKADFRNAIIVLTSNLGSERAGLGKVSLGFGAETGAEAARRAALEAARSFFRPEFLGRLDETVVFDPLGPAELSAIARTLLHQAGQRLAAHGVTLETPEAAVAGLVERAMAQRAGARPLRRLIAQEVEDRAAEGLLAGTLKPGGCFCLSVERSAKAAV